MPVILTTAEEMAFWLTGAWPDVSQLQRALPDGTLQIVAIGKRKDGHED